MTLTTEGETDDRRLSTPLVSPSFLSVLGGDFRWRERGEGSTKKGRRVPFPPNVSGSCVYSEFHALKIYLFVLSSLVSLIFLLEGRKAGDYWELISAVSEQGYQSTSIIGRLLFLSEMDAGPSLSRHPRGCNDAFPQSFKVPSTFLPFPVDFLVLRLT